MNRVAWLTLALALVGPACHEARPVAPVPARLTAWLASALEVPAPVRTPRVLHLDAPGAAAGARWSMTQPVEAGRELVLRARLPLVGGEPARLLVYAAASGVADAGPRPLTALPAAAPLGECLRQSTGPREIVCQLRFTVPAPATALLLVAEHAERGVSSVDVFEAELNDFRAADGPRLAPLVKRTSLLSEGGVSWQTALSARPGGRYVFPLELGQDAQLVFSTGHEHGSAAAPVRFVVRQDERVLLDETVAPDGRWHPHRLTLSGLPGASSRLTLESFPVPGALGQARGLWGAPRVVSPTDKPNVLLISIDALRPDHLSVSGYPRDTSPFLERFATVSTRFDRATAQAGRTWESMSSLLTGRYPAHSGVRERGVALPRDVPTLADVLSAAGYDTYAGGDVAMFPSSTFATFDEQVLAPKPPGRQYTTVPQVAQWAPRMKQGGVFAWLHLEHPHYELVPTEPGRYGAGLEGRFNERYTMADKARFEFTDTLTPAEQQQVIALYDASIRDADREVGQVLEVLENAGAADNTIIIITADHGENLGEHEFTLEHETPWDAVLHVPLFIAWPGHLPGGQAVGTGVQLIDLAPTVLSLAGLPPAPELDGRDLSGALRGGPLAEQPSIAEFHAQMYSVYFGRQHLLLNPLGGRIVMHGRALTFEKEALFALDEDPRELHNLIGGAPPAARALVGRAEQELQRLNQLAETRGTAAPGQAALEALRQAGYLQDEPAPTAAGAP